MLAKSKIVFATGNKGKLSEVQEIADTFGIVVVSPHEIMRSTQYADINEVGKSYLENAKLKANACFTWSGMPSLGDDSGLEVDVLGGRPGLFTARYAGEGATSARNIAKLLKVLEKQTIRTARFRCVLFLRMSERITYKAEAILEGSITREPRGKQGFGYDPLFEIPGTGKTLAELKEIEPKFKTHRILACERLFKGVG
jgi:XTP/dITP diphosphohydrolase